MTYSIGLDYGTNSVRALLVRVRDGYEVATSVFDYPTGKQGVILDERDANVARQHPGDYVRGIETTIHAVLSEARDSEPGFDIDQVVGIGVDATGSSPIPVDAENRALASHAKFAKHPAAQCWLWKDHTAHEEAARITELAREHRPNYIARCGNTYSSEWWWSKIWHCLKTAPEVFEAAFSWVELTDWIPSVLAGIRDPREVRRGVCAAGHKAFYSDDWGGLPDKEFLGLLDPKLAALRDRLYERAYDASHTAGRLCDEWAEKLGLRSGIPIAIGEMDVHYGAIGSGVRDGVLVKAIGTSTCDCSVIRAEEVDDIPGICGIVKGAILPGHYGIEAGQSAVGDIFNWWVDIVCEGDVSLHEKLSKEVGLEPAGASGLLALDWNNGNRTILVDQRLTGLILGQTLQTTRAEIYRALVEATAFGARMILERLAEYGVPVERIVCCGGIAEKNPFVMQIYADITGRTMQVARSSQACALGAAIAAAVVAGEHEDFAAAQDAMTGVREREYTPNEANREAYERLFGMYRAVHDAFGGVRGIPPAPHPPGNDGRTASPLPTSSRNSPDLGSLMKDLLHLKERQRA